MQCITANAKHVCIFVNIFFSFSFWFIFLKVVKHLRSRTKAKSTTQACQVPKRREERGERSEKRRGSGEKKGDQ